MRLRSLVAPFLLVLLAGCLGQATDDPTPGATGRDTVDWFARPLPDLTVPATPTPTPNATSPTATPMPPPGNGTTPTPTTSPSASTTPSPSPTSTPPARIAATILIGSNRTGVAADYSPETIHIRVGEAVVWRNLDAMRHGASAEDGSFDTGLLGKNESSTPIVFDTPGQYDYFCWAHYQSMNGAWVIVEP